jgi:hypothetical protein
VSKKHKAASPSAIQVKNWQKTISTEEKLNEISGLGKGEQIIAIWHIARFTHNSIRKIHDNANRITEGAKTGSKVFL